MCSLLLILYLYNIENNFLPTKSGERLNRELGREKEERGQNKPERRLSSRRKSAGVHQNMGGKRV